MIYKYKYLNNNIEYKKYIQQQNVVANYNGDQTAKINYSEYLNENYKNILDIGCRDGKFINKYSIYGIDIGSNALKRAVKNFGEDFVEKYIKIADIQDESFPSIFNISFDFINFSHTIEHLFDPSKALNNITKIMNENTRMLIIIPADIPRFKSIKTAILKQPYHEIFWTDLNDVLSFLSNNGLKIIN